MLMYIIISYHIISKPLRHSVSQVKNNKVKKNKSFIRIKLNKVVITKMNIQSIKFKLCAPIINIYIFFDNFCLYLGRTVIAWYKCPF